MGRIHDVESGKNSVHEARELFREYAKDIGVDLCFQGFERELADLPGCYAAPAGTILLGVIDHAPVGCVALRPIEKGIGEIKRLYVKPQYRGRGLARELAEEAMRHAFQIGYRKVRLDTLATMKAARALYESLGFKEIPAYYDNPLPDVVYFERDFYADARDIVAAHLDQIGTGRYAVTVYNDDETPMHFVSELLEQVCGLSAEVADAVMAMVHLHGSAIARRFPLASEATAMLDAMESVIWRVKQPLHVDIVRLDDAAA